MLELFRNATAKFIKENINIIRYKKISRKYSKYSMIAPFDYVSCLSLVKKFNKIPGCIIECGVWRGGMIAGIAEVLGNDRDYYLFDSFEGLPPAKEIDGKEAIQWQQDPSSHSYNDNCKAEMKWADKAMQLSEAKKYHLLKGWFDETLPVFEPKENIAMLRLDGDWYDSTMCCLVNLYPKVVKGGIIIFDDYFTWEGCSKAVHDYLSANKLTDKIYQLGTNGCYLIKTA